MNEQEKNDYVSISTTPCKNPGEIRESLTRKEGVEGWDELSRTIQSTVNFLSPKDVQYQLPQGLIEKIRELLLDETEETQAFRDDAAALIKPIKFKQEHTSNQVKSAIIGKGFGIKERKKDPLELIKFFKQYATLLDYEPVERAKPTMHSGNSIKQLSEEQKQTIAILKYIENPEAGETALKKAITSHENSAMPPEGAKPKSPKALENARKKVLTLQKIQTQAKQKDFDKTGVKEAFIKLLESTPDEVLDAVLAKCITDLHAGKEFLNPKVLTRLLDDGFDHSLACAISSTEEGRSFAQDPRNLQSMIDKRLDRALAAAIFSYDGITETHKHDDVLNFINNPAVLKNMERGGMGAALQAVTYSSNQTEEGKAYLENNPDWEEKCNAAAKPKATIFKKIGAAPIFTMAA